MWSVPFDEAAVIVDRSGLGPDVQVCSTFHREQSIAECIIAECIIAATVVLRRKFLEQDRALRTGVFATSVDDPSIPQSLSLRSARIGCVGFGHIGQRAWTLFEAFGARGAAVTGSGNASSDSLEWSSNTSDLDKLMEWSDVVVVSARLSISQL